MGVPSWTASGSPACHSSAPGSHRRFHHRSRKSRPRSPPTAPSRPRHGELGSQVCGEPRSRRLFTAAIVHAHPPPAPRASWDERHRSDRKSASLCPSWPVRVTGGDSPFSDRGGVAAACRIHLQRRVRPRCRRARSDPVDGELRGDDFAPRSHRGRDHAEMQTLPRGRVPTTIGLPDGPRVRPLPDREVRAVPTRAGCRPLPGTAAASRGFIRTWERQGDRALVLNSVSGRVAGASRQARLLVQDFKLAAAVGSGDRRPPGARAAGSRAPCS